MHGSLNEKVKDSEFVSSVFQSDFVLLSETWSNEHSDIDVKGYSRVSKIRKLKKKAKRSSGGLEVYIKENLLKGITVLKWDFEDGLSFKFDNDFFGWEKPLYLFFTYFKPQNSSRSDLDIDDDCFNILQNHISTVVDQGTVLVTGDLNSRVSNLQECILDVRHDVNVSEIMNIPLYDNCFSTSDFIQNDMFVKRYNKDTVVNSYGYKLIDLCISCDLAILNGRAGTDKGQGQTTFCGPKGESTVDYVLCDKYNLYNIQDFNVSNHLPFSDHKMLSFSMKTFVNDNSNVNENVLDANHSSLSYTKWNENKKESFISNLEEDDTFIEISKLSEKLINIDNKKTLDAVIKEFSDIITNAGSEHIKKLSSYSNNHRTGNFWYDEDCKVERVKFLKRKQLFDLNDNDFNRKEMCKQRSIYRKVCRRKRKIYNIQKANDLLILSKKDPKKYWRKLKGDKKENNTN